MDIDPPPACDAILGGTLRQAREARGWTRREVAVAAGLAPLKIHLIEAGWAALSIGMAERLSEVYDLDDSTRRALMAAAAADEQAARWLEPIPGPLSDWDSLGVLHLVTTGRRSGRRQTKAWPLFAVDGTEVLLLAPAGRADWLANVKAHPEIGIGPPTLPRPGLAHEVVEPSVENRRRRALVWKRLGQPGELKDGRLIIVEVDAEGPIVEW